MDVIKVEGLAKSFGELEVIKDISFSVRKGEALAILGPSGSGKSTLLRTITHLETAQAGTIEVCGQKMLDSGRYADKATLREILLKIGLVFQDFNLFPHFSVLRNLTEAQERVLGRGKIESANIGRALLAKMGLEDKTEAYPCELSGGQKQRASIARALALDPEILFFDEPTSALDPELTGEILKVLRGLAQDKTTMVIVTHEMAFARDVADRAIFMDGGVIVEEGPARELIASPKNERTQAFLSRFRSS